MEDETEETLKEGKRDANNLILPIQCEILHSIQNDIKTRLSQISIKSHRLILQPEKEMKKLLKEIHFRKAK